MRNRIKILMVWLWISTLFQQAMAQVPLPAFHDSMFTTYYHQRSSLFRMLPNTSGDILFAGNSITDGGEWQELFGDLRVKNRGISGDFSVGLLHRLKEMTDRRPAKMFIMIGVNDLARNVSPDSLVKNIVWMVQLIRQQSPATRIFIQSLLPVNDVYGKFTTHTSRGQQIAEVNRRLEQLSAGSGYTYVALNPHFQNSQGKLDIAYTNDGLHLTGKGYLLWKHLVFPYVYDLQPKPSLLPEPIQVRWEKGAFWLKDCYSIYVKDKTFEREGLRLKEMLTAMGYPMELTSGVPAGTPVIFLEKSTDLPKGSTDEAYRLRVSTDSIIISASSEKGAFYGLQTLRQLLRNGMAADACTITDQPAFGWRGYMIDVGRNYMSLPALKEQIDIMSRYKLNVFHFHATEDIAWRLPSVMYPQLNAPEHMLRNKGMYYTYAEVKELIDYCSSRHITFVPEIDMPGHSAAFKRAMKTDMQSDTGMQYVRNILDEFCRKIDVPYIHIGADEVRITNKAFIPEMTSFLQSKGKTVIGWEPGGNFTNNTIRQWWREDGKKRTQPVGLRNIDSRHLYLNHMDPLESVVTIFHRRIGNVLKGDSSMLGATLCVWHDRAVREESDILIMNPVYPGMLAFAERSWRGGGREGWTALIGQPGDKQHQAFEAFESRLLEHQYRYFRNMPFPYTRQANLNWKLFGPYKNFGNTETDFAPESQGFDPEKASAALTATGATVVLRHWWAPLIESAIPQPKDSTTWYAYGTVIREAEGPVDCWIGFNNLSRSPATDSPPAGAWDEKGSKVWVNGIPVTPPSWTRAGQQGNSEIPLTDEGYEFRTPTRIWMKKGINHVLIKAPVGSFKAPRWQNPVKWMFTFTEAPADWQH